MTPDEIQAASMTGFADTSEETADDPICEHIMPDPLTGIPTPANEWGHQFCPKCGKKL